MSSTGRNLPGHELDALGAYDTPPALCDAITAWVPLQHGDEILEASVGSGNMLAALARHPATYQLEAMDVDPMVRGLDLVHELGGIATVPTSSNRDPELVELFQARLDAMGVPRWRQALALAGFLVTCPARSPLWVIGNVPYSVTDPARPCQDCGATGRVPGARAGTTRKCSTCGKWPKGKRPKLADGSRLPVGWVADLVIPVADLHLRRSLEVTRRHVVINLRLNHLGGAQRFLDLWKGVGHLRAVKVCPQRPSYAHGGTDSTEAAVFWWDLEWDRDWWEGGWLPWRGPEAAP